MGDPCASTFSFWRMISKEPSKGGAPFAVIRDTVTLPLRIWDSMLSLAAVVQLTTNIPYDACTICCPTADTTSLSFSLSLSYAIVVICNGAWK